MASYQRRGYGDVPAPAGGGKRDGGDYDRRSGGGGHYNGRGYEEDNKRRRLRDNEDDYYGRNSRGNRDRDYHDGDYERADRRNGGGGDDYYDRRGGDGREEWKCFECNTRNFADEYRCARCGASGPKRGGGDRHYNAEDDYYGRRGAEDYGRRRDERYGDDRYELKRHSGDEDEGYYGRGDERRSGENEEEEELDEFGRPAREPEKLPDWPPKFEDFGNEYTFDVRSGMFYESKSDFYYDPNRKLYYGNKKKIYYKFNPVCTPPFEEVDNVPGAAPGAPGDTLEPLATLPTTLPAVGTTTSGANKPAISIKLKTKSLKPKKAKTEKAPADSATAAASSADRLQRQHASDMEKWSVRQKEVKDEQKESNETCVTKARSEVKHTAKGEPICMLCRRKFPSLEKLEYHERVSKLHKDNLAKKEKEEEEQALKKAEAARPGADYVDRAKQRRDMYGEDAMVAAAPPPPVAPVTTAVPAENHEPLGASNVGRQMLQKLGWKGGGKSEQQSNLAKDWDRIEATASASSRRGASSKNGIGSS